MKKYNYPEQNACMVKMNNRRVVAQRIDDNKIGISIKKLDKVDSKPIIMFEKSRDILGLEITETGILISSEMAFALRTALDAVIYLSDIPSECLTFNQSNN